MYQIKQKNNIMKKLFIILAVALLGFSGCKKDDPKPNGKYTNASYPPVDVSKNPPDTGIANQ